MRTRAPGVHAAIRSRAADNRSALNGETTRRNSTTTLTFPDAHAGSPLRQHNAAVRAKDTTKATTTIHHKVVKSTSCTKGTKAEKTRPSCSLCRSFSCGFVVERLCALCGSPRQLRKGIDCGRLRAGVHPGVDVGDLLV